MDIEGAEPAALKGMVSTIERSKSLAMIVEFNPGALKAGGTEPEEFLKQLLAAGFEISAIGPDAILQPLIDLVYPSAPSDWYVNLLCVKRRQA